jgi:hypothetical protein
MPFATRPGRTVYAGHADTLQLIKEKRGHGKFPHRVGSDPRVHDIPEVVH